MYDNLNSDDGLKDEAICNNANEKLDELIQDYEEKLYTIRIQLKSYVSQLEIREQELQEKELKNDNRSFFLR